MPGKARGKVTLKKNQIKGNKMVGVGGLGCANLSISGGEISGTRDWWTTDSKPILLADGVQLLEGTVALVDGVKLASNNRAGLLLDASTATITNNIFSGGQYELVTQNHQAANVTLGANTTASGGSVQATEPTKPLGLSVDPLALILNDPIPMP